MFSLWHSSHESANEQYSFFPARFKGFWHSVVESANHARFATGATAHSPCDHRRGMRRRLACLCLLCLAVAACGGSSGGGTSDRTQITNMFSALDSAMARGDYPAACAHFSQREQSRLVAGAKKAGLRGVSSCSDAFAQLIKETGITRSQLAQTFAGSSVPKIQSLSVHGNRATVTYTNTVQGKPYTETDALVREGGSWRADRTVKRTPKG